MFVFFFNKKKKEIKIKKHISVLDFNLYSWIIYQIDFE